MRCHKRTCKRWPFVSNTATDKNSRRRSLNTLFSLAYSFCKFLLTYHVRVCVCGLSVLQNRRLVATSSVLLPRAPDAPRGVPCDLELELWSRECAYRRDEEANLSGVAHEWWNPVVYIRNVVCGPNHFGIDGNCLHERFEIVHRPTRRFIWMSVELWYKRSVIVGCTVRIDFHYVLFHYRKHYALEEYDPSNPKNSTTPIHTIRTPGTSWRRLWTQMPCLQLAPKTLLLPLFVQILSQAYVHHCIHVPHDLLFDRHRFPVDAVLCFSQWAQGPHASNSGLLPVLIQLVCDYIGIGND